ncbi:LysR family transcriptional regulator [Streptomyces sp. NPDC047130]|uniref:LysR family transcriptional regulator n=1 Tax=Streptomyces sp. NPDC047130 TaxID=3155261 RepID=UPI0033DEF2F3
MDLALLRTFVAVYRAGSFTRAAALLGLSQPAVTSQIRTLERQLGRPLFLRQARGVVPTTVGDELAHKAAPHLDALVEIAETGLESGGPSTLHLSGPPEFLAERALPALAALAAEKGRPLSLRASFGNDQENLDGLAAGHCDLAVATARPRGTLLSSTPLCDEEHVLVASPAVAASAGLPVGVPTTDPTGPTGLLGAPDPLEELRARLDPLPVLEVHESLPFVSRYWSSVFGARPTVASGAVVVPDLRAVLTCALHGAGIAVLPRYLCATAREQGSLVALYEPDVPPLRTYFLVVRAGTLALPHIGRAHERLQRAAAAWA